jgi:hypothetical protein
MAGKEPGQRPTTIVAACACQSLFRPAIATWNSSQQTDIPVLNQPELKNRNQEI